MIRIKKKRLAIINSHPIQYHAPFYSYMSQDPDVDVEVFYLSDVSLRGAIDPGFDRAVRWDIDLLAGYRSRFIGRKYQKATPGGFFSLIVPGIFNVIYGGRYDAVLIHGYSHAVNLIALTAARLSGAKVFFRADTNWLLAKRRPQSVLKRLYVKSVFSACDRMLTIGTRNREFYRWMGVPEAKLVPAPFTVDNARFYAESRMSQNERIELRRSLGIVDDRPAILFLSKFVPRKRPDLAIQAAGELVKQGHTLHLVMAGSGELDAELQQLMGAYPYLSISFPGFINQSEIPRVLAACDVFAFPSTDEPWGLIVNEAMAVGLPVVVCRDSGCALDLVENGVNGYCVPAGDLTALTHALDILISDAGLRRRMGEANLKKIAAWSFRQYREGLREALGLSRSVSDESQC